MSKKPTSRNMILTAKDIIDYLQSKDLFDNVQIYVAKQRFTSERLNPNQEERYTNKNTVYYADRNINMTEYVEHADSRYISLTFEGPLYDLINYQDYDFVYNLTQKFIADYDIYFDMINTFTLAAYHM